MLQQREPLILLADDDEEDREMLKGAVLEQSPEARVDSVWNGRDVIKYLEDCPADGLPCLLVLDYKMPFLNAAEVLKKLEHFPGYGPIPKVVWSTSNQREHIEACMGNGASLFVTKPKTTTELASITREMLALCRAD